jgi:hypothetical protein
VFAALPHAVNRNAAIAAVGNFISPRLSGFVEVKKYSELASWAIYARCRDWRVRQDRLAHRFAFNAIEFAVAIGIELRLDRSALRWIEAAIAVTVKPLDQRALHGLLHGFAFAAFAMLTALLVFAVACSVHALTGMCSCSVSHRRSRNYNRRSEQSSNT